MNGQTFARYTCLLLAAIAVAIGLGRADDWARLNAEGRQFAAAGRIAEAEASFRAALAQLGAASEDSRYIETTIYLGRVFTIEGKTEAAERLYRDVLPRSRTNRSPGIAALLLNLLGETCRTQRRFAEARGYYDEARAILAVIPDTEAQQNAVMANIAALLVQQGRYREAEAAFLSVVQTQERLTGADSFEAINTYSNVAALYERAGDCGRAEAMAQRAVAICESKNSAAHPGCVAALNHLGAAYSCGHRYAAASTVLARIVALLENDHTGDTAGLFAALSNLAAALSAQGQTDQAEGLYRRALDLSGAETDAEALRTTLTNYAHLLRHMRRKREAHLLEERARNLPAHVSAVDVLELSRRRSW